MSTYGPREPRSNKEVARNMLIAGVVLLAFYTLTTFSEIWISDHLNEWNAKGWSPLFDVWRWVLVISPALGSAFVVGAIIVNRLPERSQTSVE